MSAPIERCFDLARSIDLHKDSVSFTQERAVGGVTSGLIGMGQEVEWQARHFAMSLGMRVRITAFTRPTYFQDTMVQGPFRSFVHDHTFAERNGVTVMEDRLNFAAPVPVLGKLLDSLVLKAHLRHLLETRNLIIKSTAESEQWHKYLSFPKS